MKNCIKKYIVLIIAIALLISGMTVYATAAAQTSLPLLVGETAVLIDAKSGMVLYNKSMDEQREPASTTKIITGLLAIENLDLDKVVTIDEETSVTEGSRIYLLEGEQITVRDLLYALFLESANDAAVALAKEMAGSIDDFAIMMNEKAIELGAKNTNFVNPHGLHAEGHLTTAYDMAMMAKAAMENETFRKYVTTYKHTIPATNMQDTRYLYNTNRLLYDTKTKVSANGEIRTAKYEGVTGIKTGYTSHAGGCLAASALRDGTELIAVVMKSTDSGRFGDSIALLDWGFENYKTVQTLEKGDKAGEIRVKGGAVKYVSLVAEKDCYATVPIGGSTEDLTRVVKAADEIEVPVKKGQSAGTIDFFSDDILVNSVNLVAAEDVEKGGPLSVFGISDKTANKIFISAGVFFGVIAAAAGGLLYIRRHNRKKSRLRRAERAMKLAMEREMQKVYENKERYRR